VTPPRIGILGAPGTGKTDLAHDLWCGWPHENRPYLVDLAGGNGSEQRTSAYGFPLGEKGSWRTSLALWAKLVHFRSESEDEIAARGVIEVGTCFDRMAHCGQRINALTARLLDVDFTDTERQELLHLQQVLPCLAIALVETWNYDYAFYLPVGDDASEFEKGVDEALRELMESYIAAGSPLNILKLDDGSSSDRADTVLRVLQEFEPRRIENLRKIEAAEDLLRGRGEDGLDESDGDEVAEGTERQPAG